MKILAVNAFGQSELLTIDYMPVVGHNIDVFCRPFPVVSKVLIRPRAETIKEFGIDVHVDAIITVE